MTNRLLRILSGLALVCLAAAPAAAQDAVLSQFYGSGVHHYFAGNYSQATEDLSAAINGGSKDPRPYYFRALAQMRSGDSTSAQADLTKGAALESADANLLYPVGKSLERVQGSDRRTIERFRAVARAQSYERQTRRDMVRYENLKRAEAQVLRAPIAPPPVAPPVEAADDPFAEEGGKKPEADPFAGDAEKPAAAPADAPAEMPAETPEAPAGDNPFGDTPATPAPPAAEPPAADPPAAAPETPPAAGDDANPFSDAPAADAPATPAAEPPAAQTPAPPAAQPPTGEAPAAAPPATTPPAQTPAPPAAQPPSAEPPAGEAPAAAPQPATPPAAEGSDAKPAEPAADAPAEPAKSDENPFANP